MSNVSSLDDLKKKKGGTDAPAADDGSNEYYAGGATRGGSGLAVVGGSDPANNEDIVQRAQNDTNEAPATEEELGNAVTITLFRNGFKVNEGRFRPRGDEANDNFLSALAKGQSPPELLTNGQPPLINLVDQSTVDCTDIPIFSGAGNSIGTNPGQTVPEDDVINPDEAIEVDQAFEGSKIRVQVKYPNNKKVKYELYRTSLVSQLVSLINQSGLVQTRYILLDARRKRLGRDKFALTVAEAKLVNSTVSVSTKFKI